MLKEAAGSSKQLEILAGLHVCIGVGGEGVKNEEGSRN